MPREVCDEPERQRDERAEDPPSRRPPAEQRRHGEHEQARCPFREHDVLQQVRPEKRVQRERLELGRECREDEHERAGRCCDAEAAKAARHVRAVRTRPRAPARGRAPPPRGSCRYASRASCGCSSMVELQPSKLATRVRFPPPASAAASQSAGPRERCSWTTSQPFPLRQSTFVPRPVPPTARPSTVPVQVKR